MNRLTDRSKEIPLPCTGNGVFWARVHEKLARYEDSGLEPEQCAKYAQAEKEGRLLVLPCGDDVTAIRKELLAAVQLLRNECKNRDPNKDCGSDRCPIWEWCDKLTEENGGGASPCFWPDPEEGGGKDG